MKLLNSFKKKSAETNSTTFSSLALELFQYQAKSCDVYQKYLKFLDIDARMINDVYQIPCMPIDFFKWHEVKTSQWEAESLFLSSGTTGVTRSAHAIEDVGYYLDNSKNIFETMYGPLSENVFFALLPSYQEQGHSSLVRMVDFFIEKSQSADQGGFYFNRPKELIDALQEALATSDKEVILFGVGYALLDLCELAQSMDVRLDDLTIIETGGMKGRRKDMVKSEFYTMLKQSLGDIRIHSEYGMTELLSQAYSTDGQFYRMPDQMRILIRDTEDPFAYLPNGRVGGINVIDLANVHSCAFIETRDLGRVFSEVTFEILGRLDNSDIRGCNLMVV